MDEIEDHRAGKTNRKAIASLVLGILGLTGVLFVAAIVAIAIGRGAYREIDATGGSGRGLATTGIVFGWIGLIWFVALVIFFWAADTSVSTAATVRISG